MKKKKKNSQNNNVDSRNFDEITAHSCSNSSICVEPSCGEVGGSSIFMILLKFFPMVVLALSTKKVAVGITLSAFVLLCLEYLGKHFLYFFKPCFGCERSFEIYDSKDLNFNSIEEIFERRSGRRRSCFGRIGRWV